jgi:peptidoglycan/LPS O-acetylase OafA/YrhL
MAVDSSASPSVMAAHRTALPEHNLDIMRAVAVLSVLFAHLMRTVMGGTVSTIAMGRIGVLIFFVHTSLVLMSSLERITVTTTNWRLAVRTFYVRRFFRIYPLAWVLIYAALVFHLPEAGRRLGYPPNPDQPHTVFQVVVNTLLVQNVFHTESIQGVMWSLPVELQMYLVLPFLFLIARRSVRSTLVVLAVVLPVAAFQCLTTMPGVWRLNVIGFGPCFIAGVLAYAILVARPQRRTIAAGWWIPLLAAGIGLEVVLLDVFPADSPLPGWPLCLMLGVLIPFVRNASRSWITETGRVIAKYSYGIYMTHIPAIVIAFEWIDVSYPVRCAVFVSLLVGFSYLAYHLIEDPGIRIGVKVANRMTRKAAAA